MQPTVWFSQVRESHFVKHSLLPLGVGTLLILFANNAYAADFGTVLANLRNIINPLTILVLTVSFTIGMILIFTALTKMKKFGQGMTMYAQPGEFAGPLTYLIVGAVLIFLPTSTDYLMNSLFDGASRFITQSGTNINYQAMGRGASLLSYTGSAGIAQHWADLANTLVMFIQFLGFLSFVKGWLILAKSTQPGHQPGAMSKGLTHVIGGIVLINFVGAVNILKNTIYGR